jgi:hypothetical protein
MSIRLGILTTNFKNIILIEHFIFLYTNTILKWKKSFNLICCLE